MRGEREREVWRDKTRQSQVLFFWPCASWMGVTPVKPASFSSSSHCFPLITGFPVLNFIVISKVEHKGSLVGIAALALSQLAQTIIKYIFGKNYSQRLYCFLRNVQVFFDRACCPLCLSVYRWRTRAVHTLLYPPAPKSLRQLRELVRVYIISKHFIKCLKHFVCVIYSFSFFISFIYLFFFCLQSSLFLFVFFP